MKRLTNSVFQASIISTKERSVDQQA